METLSMISVLNLKDLYQKGLRYWTWSGTRNGSRIVGRCDGILTTDIAKFKALQKNTMIRFGPQHVSWFAGIG
jgi:hypothetical protein